MISPNLYAIWVFLLMNLSQDLKCFLLRYFGTLDDGYSLKGSNKKPSRHSHFPDFGHKYRSESETWNRLPDRVELTEKSDSFKKELKKLSWLDSKRTDGGRKLER
jgi:hypothetical protein